jgi:maltose phosphorylase
VAKVASRYYAVDPWNVVENGFDPQHGRVSESVFSLANEYMGVRGYFDEGYGGDRLTGVYLNGVYEETIDEASHYRGITNRMTFMANTVDWLYTRIQIDGETLDLATAQYDEFSRRLDLRSGLLERTFVWTTCSGNQVRLSFQRLLSMSDGSVGAQRITITPLDFTGHVDVITALDASMVHESRHKALFSTLRQDTSSGITSILARTEHSGHMVHAAFLLDGVPAGTASMHARDQVCGVRFRLDVVQGTATSFDKLANIQAEKRAGVDPDEVWRNGLSRATTLRALSFDRLLAANKRYWSEFWDTFDISIEGDAENLQGIRYCMFQLNQTYRGSDPTLNIGAKGLTGEAYNGHAFWDSETYCLTFYLLTNPQAARNLLEYRYNTLPQALDRARMLDCRGACYPIATLDGTESCNLWQHASLQFQPTTGVAYAIWHYVKVTGDTDFLYSHGVEMLVQISRFLASRGQWGPRTGEFGYYCVMGPDEFQMMVNNNAYTNFMAKKTLEYTIEVLSALKADSRLRYDDITERLGVRDEAVAEWGRMAGCMRIPRDCATGVYEQHDGYFDLPHVDVDAIPVTDFPLYSHWSYDRIYRNDMIKQPDVLMFMYLYNQQFSLEAKRANYEYYEPRCIHESSLSPSVHSILAAELGRNEEAFEFFRFATRLDLDDYNRNTREGLHVTSIAAAWLNIVYGFGGTRSDGDMLTFSPSLPAAWTAYSFRVLYRGAVIKVEVTRDGASFETVTGGPVTVRIYGDMYVIGGERLSIPALRTPALVG